MELMTQLHSKIFVNTYDCRYDFIGNVFKDNKEIGICFYSDDNKYYVFVEEENILTTESLQTALTKFLKLI